MTPPVGSLLVGVRLAEADQFGHHLVDALRLEAPEGEADHGRHPDPRSALKPDLAQHLVQPGGLVRVAEREAVAMLRPDLGAGVLNARRHELTIAWRAENGLPRTHEITGLSVCYNAVVQDSNVITMNSTLRLPLTLIPRSCWEQNVRTALPGRWDEIRHEVYGRARHRCEACVSGGGGRPLHAHEYWGYEGGRQVLRHIACLCDVCHASTHLGRTRSFSGSDQAAHEALVHLAQVNGSTVPQAAVYARQELARTAELSMRKFTLDLSLLEREFGTKLAPAGSARSGGSWLRQLLGASR